MHRCCIKPHALTFDAAALNMREHDPYRKIGAPRQHRLIRTSVTPASGFANEAARSDAGSNGVIPGSQ